MVGLVFWALVLILGFSYFGITIDGIVNSPVFQANAAAVFTLLSAGLHDLLHLFNR